MLNVRYSNIKNSPSLVVALLYAKRNRSVDQQNKANGKSFLSECVTNQTTISMPTC
jgi:hypothetical protein